MELNRKQINAAEDSTVITTIDAHAAGEPLRIITGGLPELQGATMLEQRRYMQQHYDHIRKALMWEPRGHRDMYGCLLTKPVTPEADLGVLFMHNEGYSTMCGHGVIALVTTLVKTGALPAKGLHMPVNLDTPAGLVRATVHLDSRGLVEHVSFLNVPSFLSTAPFLPTSPKTHRTTVAISAFLPMPRSIARPQGRVFQPVSRFIMRKAKLQTVSRSPLKVFWEPSARLGGEW